MIRHPAITTSCPLSSASRLAGPVRKVVPSAAKSTHQQTDADAARIRDARVRAVGWRASHMNFAASAPSSGWAPGATACSAIIWESDGKVRDTVMYSMLADEWPASEGEAFLRGGCQLPRWHLTGANAWRSAALPHRRESAAAKLAPITSDNLFAVLRLNPRCHRRAWRWRPTPSRSRRLLTAQTQCHVQSWQATSRWVHHAYDPTLDPELAVKDKAHPDSIDIWRLMVDFSAAG